MLYIINILYIITNFNKKTYKSPIFMINKKIVTIKHDNFQIL